MYFNLQLIFTVSDNYGLYIDFWKSEVEACWIKPTTKEFIFNLEGNVTDVVKSLWVSKNLEMYWKMHQILLIIMIASDKCDQWMLCLLMESVFLNVYLPHAMEALHQVAIYLVYIDRSIYVVI